MERNRTGVMGSTVLLLIPEGAGAGVYYELGLADAVGKDILAFGPPPLAEQGIVPLGHWLSIPPDNRIESLTQLCERLLDLLARRGR